MSDSLTAAPVMGPRPYPITGDDHRGIVLSMSILFIIYAFMVLAMRLASKYRRMGIEDWLAVGGTAVATAQLITVIVATVDGGFGSSFTLLNSADDDIIAKALRASDILLLLALFLGKFSVIWLCRRLFAVGQHQRHLICEAVIGLCALWCLGSIFAVTIGCSAGQMSRTDGGKCSSLVQRWTAVGVIDALLEVAILGVSCMVVFPLKMNWNKKVQASLCFILRLPIIVLIALNIKYVSDFNAASETDAGVGLTSPIMFREAEMLYSLLSAAIPALNQYLRKFDTSNTTQFGYSPGDYGSGGGAGQSYQLGSLGQQTSLKSSTGNWTSTSVTNGILNKNTPNGHYTRMPQHYHATVEGGNNGVNNDRVSNNSHEEGSIERQNSEDLIIRKDVEYSVRRE